MATQAELMALARKLGWSFEWDDDWHVQDHQKEYDCYEDGNPETCEMVTLKDREGNVLASVGCIDDADEVYRREVACELVDEALYHLEKRGGLFYAGLLAQNTRAT